MAKSFVSPPKIYHLFCVLGIVFFVSILHELVEIYDTRSARLGLARNGTSRVFGRVRVLRLRNFFSLFSRPLFRRPLFRGGGFFFSSSLLHHPSHPLRLPNLLLCFLSFPPLYSLFLLFLFDFFALVAYPLLRVSPRRVSHVHHVFVSKAFRADLRRPPSFASLRFLIPLLKQRRRPVRRVFFFPFCCRRLVVARRRRRRSG